MENLLMKVTSGLTHGGKAIGEPSGQQRWQGWAGCQPDRTLSVRSSKILISCLRAKQIHIGLACNKRSWTYCINHGIAFTVYFPLGSDKFPLLKNSIALKLADKHKVQVADILKGFKLFG
jgi:hypothetical protein